MPAEIPATIVARNLQAALDQRGAVLNGAAIEKRGLTPDEAHRYATLTATIADLQERKSEIADLERRTKLDNAAHANSGIPESGLQSGYHVGGGTVYHRGPESNSFFADLINSRRGDYHAAERLARNNTETGFQSRALGNTGGTGGSGGEFGTTPA